MDLRSIFDSFNPARFFVFSMLFIFTLLFAMRRDDLIRISYWIVFFPLWIWKFIVIMGFLSGTVAWCYQPRGQYYFDTHYQYKAMALSTSYQIVLLFFEILACDKLENDRNKWIFVCIPLLILCIFGVAVCIWSLKNDQHFEMELILSANTLLFIFIALKLDDYISWSWNVIFIPLWVLTSVAIVFELYGLMLAFILCRSPELLPQQRRHTIMITCGYAFVIFPLLIFEVLLTKKLDDKSFNYPHIIIVCPLLFAIVALIVMAFLIRGDNPWWFGAKKPLCLLVLEICEPLQEYGNVSYKFKSALQRLPPKIRDPITKEMLEENEENYFSHYLKPLKFIESHSPLVKLKQLDSCEDVSESGRKYLVHLPNPLNLAKIPKSCSYPNESTVVFKLVSPSNPQSEEPKNPLLPFIEDVTINAVPINDRSFIYLPD